MDIGSIIGGAVSPACKLDRRSKRQIKRAYAQLGAFLKINNQFVARNCPPRQPSEWAQLVQQFWKTERWSNAKVEAKKVLARNANILASVGGDFSMLAGDQKHAISSNSKRVMDIIKQATEYKVKGPQAEDFELKQMKANAFALRNQIRQHKGLAPLSMADIKQRLAHARAQRSLDEGKWLTKSFAFRDIPLSLEGKFPQRYRDDYKAAATAHHQIALARKQRQASDRKRRLDEFKHVSSSSSSSVPYFAESTPLSSSSSSSAQRIPASAVSFIPEEEEEEQGFQQQQSGEGYAWRGPARRQKRYGYHL
jgi:hypothetical protein